MNARREHGSQRTTAETNQGDLASANRFALYRSPSHNAREIVGAVLLCNLLYVSKKDRLDSKFGNLFHFGITFLDVSRYALQAMRLRAKIAGNKGWVIRVRTVPDMLSRPRQTGAEGAWRWVGWLTLRLVHSPLLKITKGLRFIPLFEKLRKGSPSRWFGSPLFLKIGLNGAKRQRWRVVGLKGRWASFLARYG